MKIEKFTISRNYTFMEGWPDLFGIRVQGDISKSQGVHFHRGRAYKIRAF